MAAKHKKKKKNLSGSLTLAGFLLIVGLTGGAIYKSEKDLKATEQSYIEREEKLQKEISEQEARQKTLEERKKYVSTDQYIEEVAKERLGLLSPDEVLLKENTN